MMSPNANLNFGDRESGAGAGGAGISRPTSVDERIQELVTECAGYPDGSPGKAACEQRLSSLVAEKNKTLQAMSPKPLANVAPGASGQSGGGAPGASSGGFSTQAALGAVETDPDMAELERLTRLYNANSGNPTMQMEIHRRMTEVSARMRMRNEASQKQSEHERFAESEARRQAAEKARAKDTEHYRFVNWMRQMYPDLNSRDIEESWADMSSGGASQTFDAFERYKRASAAQAAAAPQPADLLAERSFNSQVRSDSTSQFDPVTREQILHGEIDAVKAEAAARQAQQADPAFQQHRAELRQVEEMMRGMKLSEDTKNMLRQRLRSGGTTAVEIMNYLNRIMHSAGAMNPDVLMREVLKRANQGTTPLDQATDPDRAQRLGAALANGKITPEQYNQYMYNEQPLPADLM